MADPKDRDWRSTPAKTVPTREFDDEELTPIRAIADLKKRFDDHADDDRRAIAGVHDSIRALDARLTGQVAGLDTRLTQQIADVGSTQTKLLNETAGQTVMLSTAVKRWDEDRAAAAIQAVTAAQAAKDEQERQRREDEKARDTKMDRRTKVTIAVVGGVLSLATGVIVHLVS